MQKIRYTTYCIVWLFWIMVIFNMIATFMPDSAPAISGNTKQTLSTLFPQGWAFFTKSPRELINDAYSITSSNIARVSIPNTSVENYYGFSRKSRYITYEIDRLLDLLPQSSWVSVVGEVKSNSVLNTVNIKVNFRVKYFNNNQVYLITKHKIIPWAWAKYSQKDNIPYLVMKIRIIK